jgi:hypothetical protein
MASRWLTVVLCLLTVGGISAALGCSEYLSAERNRRRAYVVKTDWEHAGTDLDWMLGLDVPSSLYEDSFSPYP